MEEVVAVRVLLERVNFDRYYKYLEKLNFENEIKTIIALIHSYYEEYPSSNSISLEELKVFFNLKYPLYKDKESYYVLFNNIEGIKELNEDLIDKTLKNLLEKHFASEIVESLTKVLSGTKYGILESVKGVLEKYNTVSGNLSEPEEIFVCPNLEQLLASDVHADGVKWRLQCLNEDIGDLRGGSLGHVYARPDTGKTTFFASEISFFASQIGDDEEIIWFNNEERGQKVQLRIYSAITGRTLDEIAGDPEGTSELFDKLGGNKIRIYDNAVITVSDIDAMLKDRNVRIVVIDQGDKIKFSGDKDMATHERLKALYGKLRELAKKYNVDIITAGQADYTAEGRQFLHLSNMDNSKTGKPGELDYAIGIGYSFDEGKESLRYIHVSKNKMKNGAHGKHSVRIDTLRARYEDLTYEGVKNVQAIDTGQHPGVTGRPGHSCHQAASYLQG